MRMLKLIVAIFVVFIAFVFNAPSSFAVALQGTLKSQAGSPLENMRVDVFGVATGVTATAFTNQAGLYLFNSLPQDQYRLYYSTPDGSDGAWYGDGTCNLTPVAVTAQNDSIVDFTVASIAATGIIKGTVTDTTGKVLSGVWVDAYSRDKETAISTTTTDINGIYSMTVPAGDMYSVLFFPFYNNRVPEYYNNIPITHQNAATIFNVKPNDIITANAELSEYGSIKGVVADACGTPVKGALVKAVDSNGYIAGTATTDQSGTGVYEITWLPPGNYKVYFELPTTQLRQWYPNQPTANTAGLIAVSAGVATTGINGSLESGSIAGTVLDSLGNGLQYSVTIRLFDAANSLVASVSPTDSNGNYHFDALKVGIYKVYFDYGCSSEWAFDKKALGSADSVSVSACNQTIVNSTLGSIGSVVSGEVISGSSVPIEGVTVAIYDSLSGMTIATTTTDSNGNYSINSISSGSYKIYFKPLPNSEFIASWGNNKTDFMAADAMIINSPTVIDAILERNTAIAGTVTNESGAAISWLRVDALNSQTGIVVASSYSDNAGAYMLSGLTAGTYKVRFNGFRSSSSTIGYTGEYYNNKTTLVESDPVVINSFEIKYGIDAVLTSYVVSAGSITGNVVNHDNAPLTNVSVQVLSTSGSVVGNASTDVNGNYSVGGLSAGSYKVKFSYYNPSQYKYYEQWYYLQATTNTASLVSVDEGVETANINAAYSALGQITGNIKVVNTCKPRITTQANACAYSTTTKKQVACGYVDQTGSYSINLEPGTYKVLFTAWDSDKIAKKWFGDSYDSSSAATVTVISGSTAPSINTILFQDAGSVSGKILDSTAKPVESTCVNNTSQSSSVAIYDKNQYMIESATSDMFGNYSILHLPPGEYKAVAGSSSGISFYYGSGKRFNNTWYSGQVDFSSANLIPLLRNNVPIDFMVTMLAPHSIVSGGNSGGRISPSGAFTVKPGGSSSYTITPDSGYKIFDVTVDGSSIGPVSSYSFSNVLEDHTIQVVFQEIVNDTTKPLITAFSLPLTSNSFTVPITLSATDNTLVTGYCITDVNDSAACPWTTTAQLYYTFIEPGTKTIYAFVKDAAGNISLSSSASTTVSLPQLTIQLNGVGNGTVNRNPAGIACSKGTCTALYENNTVVSLLPTQSAGSVFFGWSGACSGSSTCSLVMDGDKNVTACFAIFNPIVKLESQPPSYYLALSTAYAAIAGSTPATLLLQEGVYNEDLISDKSIELDLKGGYEHSFTTASGYSLVNSMTLAAGSLVVDRLIISSQTETSTATPSAILMLDGAEPLLFSTFKTAIDVIPEYSAATIKAGIGILNGGVNLNRDIQLKLLGGFDSTMTKQDGYLHIRGGLVITLGSLTVDGIVLE